MGNGIHNDVGIDTVSGERGLPSVNDSKPSKGKQFMVIVTTLLFCGLIAAMAYWQYQRIQTRKEAANTDKYEVQSSLPKRTFQDPPRAQEMASAIPVIPFQPNVATAAPPPLPGYENTKTTHKEQILDKSSSPLMVSPDTDRGNRGNIADRTVNSESQLADKDGLSSLLSPTKTESRQAGVLGNRNFLLAKGAMIDCALQTKLITTVSGMTSCITTRNIYSDNGKVILIERGSTITGEYQARLLRQGMARIFVLWDRVKTWNGVIINLDSPGTDQLGGAGLPGYIDTHFWERFGAALMLSLVDDVARGVTAGINDSANGNNQFNFGGSGSGLQNMPAEALKYTINIPPTLYKNQGEQVAVYVARDLDFSSVYDVAVE